MRGRDALAEARALMGADGDKLVTALVTLDPARTQAFYAAVKTMPAVAGVALREMTLRNFRETMDQTMNMQVFFNVLFAAVIAFGVVYNSARVSLSERSHELASLRVLGFTRGTFGGYLAFASVQAIFIHANVRLDVGPLRWLLATPQRLGVQRHRPLYQPVQLNNRIQPPQRLHRPLQIRPRSLV